MSQASMSQTGESMRSRLMLLTLTAAVGCGALAGCGGRPQVAWDPQNVERIRGRLGGGEEASADSAEAGASEPTGFATLTGKFVFGGQAPDRKPVALSGEDAGRCSPGGQPPLDESVLVGAGGGLRNVVFYLSDKRVKADDPKWVHPDYDATKGLTLEGRGTGFDQEHCVFLTHVFAMRSSQQLQIINSDSFGHNTNISGGDKTASFNQVIAGMGNTVYSPGGACAQPFSVTCNIHPWMKAYMIVRDDPYFAVTGEDGSFTLANVPAGVELEFRAWHEAMTIQSVKVDGADAEWRRGRVKLTLQPGESRELTVEVSPSNLK